MSLVNKRLLKKHRRQVARVKAQVKVSEPDVRTPEQVKAAREASRPAGGALGKGGAHAGYTGPSAGNRSGAAAHSPAKADG